VPQLGGTVVHPIEAHALKPRPALAPTFSARDTVTCKQNARHPNLDVVGQKPTKRSEFQLQNNPAGFYMIEG
jgi:hypothetical protein